MSEGPIRRPISFVLASTAHGTMIVNRNDYCKTETAQFGVGNDLLENSFFDYSEVEAGKVILDARHRHHGDGVVAVDCGANIGVQTIEWARHLHGRGSVHAFEAQTYVFYALAGNIVINNCLNANAYHAAIGAEVGSIAIPNVDYNRPASYGSVELKYRSSEYIGQDIYSSGVGTEVNLVSIDSLGLPRIDFIKIDVEGMEVDVLAGAMEALQRCRPVIQIEWIKSNKQNLINTLTSLGYTIKEFGINLLAVHKDDTCGAELGFA